MFTSPAPPPPGTHSPLTTSTSTPTSTPTPTTAPTTATTTSSSRGSRLRDLINIRNYAYSHLLSRDHNQGHEDSTIDTAATPSASSSSPHVSSPRSHNTTRPRSHTATATTRRDNLPWDPPPSPVGLVSGGHTLPNDRSIADPNTHQELTPNPEPPTEPLSRSRTVPDLEHNAAFGTQEPNTVMTRTRSATTGDSYPDMLPSIRFSAFYDPRSNRPSLSFTPMSRTLPTGKEVIRVGRYSERENHPPVPTNAPSAAPVGFKSKVVSRRHCEFWYEQNKWYIRDVKSSSGTFLNHIRLSAPGTESKPFPINDGDIVQLGIDFKGGEEMIYRCVKMRIELNRGWQAKPNSFNMATHKRLRNMTSATSATSAASHAQDCSICLNAIAPCQSLFVAPCSHTWHYKCIRELLIGPSAPIFICPNCRAAADLDAEVDEPSDEWQQLDSGIDEVQEEKPQNLTSQLADRDTPMSGAHNSSDRNTPESSPGGGDVGDVTVHVDHSSLEREPSSRPMPSDPVPIPNSTNRTTIHSPSVGLLSAPRGTRTPSPEGNPTVNITEGPLTPRNDAGPWVFDGNPARVSQESSRRPGMSSLDAAAQAGIE